ncbi:response regulator [bacterium]|nr:response regulator [bacterium]
MKIEEVRVLIADREPTTVGLIRRSLRGMGFRSLETTTNGYQTLIALKKNSFDLLLLDWRLPNLDGETITRYLRRIPRYRQPKMIAMIASSDREAVQKGVQLGLQDYLVKPFRGRVLQERIEKVLDIRIL